MSGPLRLLMLSPEYPPVPNSAARLSGELAEDLVAAGHRVTVITRNAEGGGILRRDRRTETGGITVWRMAPTPLPRRFPLARAVDQAWQAGTYWLRGRGLGHHDAIFAYSPPQPLTLTGALLAKRWRAPLIVNVQDAYPQTGVDLGLLGGPTLKASEWMERYMYRHATAITVYGDGAKDLLTSRGASMNQVRVIPNWVDLEGVRPGPLKNAWRRDNGLEGRFIVSFAGTMGFAQGLEDMLEAAPLLADLSDVTLVLAGDGVMRSALQAKAREMGLANVVFLPFQHGEDYLSMLQASDVGIASLDPRLTTPVVPGKLQTLMAVGRPLVCTANASTGLPQLMDESGAGVFVPAGDPQAFATAVRRLHDDPAEANRMGVAGRSYAEAHFARSASTGAYLDLLTELTEG